MDAGLPEGVVRHGRVVTCDILAETSTAVGLTPASFGFIVAWDVLEHLAAPEQQMRRLHSLLKPGGRIYLTLPNSTSLVARVSTENIHGQNRSKKQRIVADPQLPGRCDTRYTWAFWAQGIAGQE